jgi:tetratricopeptide (TPR) repeat protein
MPEPMDKPTAIKDIKKLIAQGEIGDAFEKLAGFLSTAKGNYGALHKDVLQAQAKYSKLEKDSTLGIISSEEAKLQFNQSTRQLLYFLEVLEGGPAKLASTKKTPPMGIIAIVAVVIIGLGIGWWYFNRDSGSEEVAGITDESCPNYSKQSKLNILILPFRSLGGKTGNPHIAILNNLAELIDEYKILSDIKTYLLDEEDPNAYPATNNDASSIAQSCQAQLVIWGFTEKVQDETIVKTKYHFESADSNLQLQQIELNNNSQTDTLSSISSISTNGLLTAEIEDIIKIIFGLVAHNTGNNEASASILEEVSPTDSATSLLTGMVLAENYLRLEKPEEAKITYDKVLEQHPESSLARNNRGILNYLQGHYLDAAEDLSIALEKDSSNTKLLETRGKAYMGAEQYKEAREDFTKASMLMPAASESILENLNKVDTIINELDSAIKTKATINNERKRSFRDKNQSVEQLVERASINKKLGHHEQAIAEATQALKIDSKNVEAYAILLDIYRTRRDDQKVKSTIQKIMAAEADFEAIAGKVYFQLKNKKDLRKKLAPIK